MGKYIAVTIGPIGDTMALSSKPASLWAASYMFSFLAKNICNALVEDSICTCNEIVTPYFDPDDPLINRNDGVGVFHDHIIFRCGKDISAVKDSFAKALSRTAEAFDVDIGYLQSTVNISACSFDSDESEIILRCAKMLDCMELTRRFNSLERRNELSAKFSNNEISNTITEKLGIAAGEFQLFKDGRIKSLAEIAYSKRCRGYKKNRYFCILRADGDNMSKIIADLENEQECREFSKTCLQYCSNVAAEVRRFGGVTIYAGGDDLLALTPCENESGETVFDLIGSINKVFSDSFKSCSDNLSAGIKVGLSFGLFIGYEKFPLYEALDLSAYQLFGIAKDKQKGGKNCIAVRLQKHSGQSVELCISNDALDAFNRRLKPAIEQERSKDGTEKVFLSAGQKVALFSVLFDNVDSGSASLFRNTFDADFHLSNSASYFHRELPDFFDENITTGKIRITDSGSRAQVFAAVLRIIKFFVEKEVK
ncbi:MAG: hypothetical protein K6G90_05745 [Clostridia bacterium]|nr:hypothetical protein [Clostridia bacterium]